VLADTDCLAILGISYLHLVFGFEATYRALRNTPFTQRNVFAPLINVIITWVFLIVTILVGKFTGYDVNRCYAGIVFLGGSLGLNKGMIGLMSGVTLVLFTMAFIIYRRLARAVHMDPGDRVGGSRMVYYLILSGIINVRCTELLKPRLMI
jgi:hypothetical protein